MSKPESDTADLCERLNGMRCAGVEELCWEAAREIERLRAAIRAALSFRQMTHVHAALREAVGYGD